MTTDEHMKYYLSKEHIDTFIQEETIRLDNTNQQLNTIIQDSKQKIISLTYTDGKQIT